MRSFIFTYTRDKANLMPTPAQSFHQAVKRFSPGVTHRGSWKLLVYKQDVSMIHRCLKPKFIINV